MPGFAEAWRAADAIGGWLTRAQGAQLWAAARAVPRGGHILEIGSHQGRSTVVLARAAQDVDASVIAIDPFVEGRLFGGAPTRIVFEANLDRAGVADTVRLIVRPSHDVRADWHEPLAMLYIDGKHDYWTVRDDLRWIEHLADGAPVLVHDSFSSIGVTLALIVHVLPGRQLRYLGRVGSLAHFQVGGPSARDRLRLLAQVPWFVRNVAIKIALRAARLVGYRGTPDPY